MKLERRLRVRNSSPTPKVLWLEPWGEDYWLQANEEFDIIAKDIDGEFYFQVDFGEQIVVWAEGQVIDIGIYQAGNLLHCVHQRVKE